MDVDVKRVEMHNHQHTAQKLLELSPTLKQLFQDQWFYLWSLTPDNLFVIHKEQQRISVADGLLEVYISDDQPKLIDFTTPHPDISVQKIADFIFNDIHFLLQEFNAFDSLFLQSKVQIFRQILVESVFEWIDGENRVEHYLYNLSEYEADAIDQLMIEAGYYSVPHLKLYATQAKAFPLSVEVNIKHLCLVNSVLGDAFLPIQKLLPHYEHLCFSARKFIPAHMYRILQTILSDRFCLADLINHQQDFELLSTHAQDNPRLLAFTRLIKREYWHCQEILNKPVFLQKDHEYWIETFNSHGFEHRQAVRNQYPICSLKRTVNWLFKQDSIVNDWIARNIDHADTRVTITALSFLDTTSYHPQVILSTLKYFDSSSARIFIQECARYASRSAWFEHASEVNYQDVLSKQPHHKNYGNKISRSIPATVLYVEEWLQIFQQHAQHDAKIAKLIFKNLNLVIQAFMKYLHEITKNIPKELMPFIQTETQQSAYFYHALKHYQLDPQEFRKIFKHQHRYVNQSVCIFESYVADYLIDLFNRGANIAKNVTWSGLYQQAVKWHEQVYFEDTLRQLRLRVNIEQWPRISTQEQFIFEGWAFCELNSLKQIIQESIKYKHCLALSYTELIVEGLYLAFHMTSLEDENLHLTLGCYHKKNQLEIDQLRMANNEKPQVEIEKIAIRFIDELNKNLRLQK